MKLKRPERIKPPSKIKAIEVFGMESNEENSFIPERDIPLERQNLFFNQLAECAQDKAWLEYIFLYNKLELLFPKMNRGKKAKIPLEEVRRCFEQSGRPRDMALTLGKWNDRFNPEDVLVELKTYGIPLDDEMFKEKLEAYNDLPFKNAEYKAVALTRLGLSPSEEKLKMFSVSIENIRIKIAREKNKTPLDLSYIVSLAATARILFPEEPLKLEPELISRCKQAFCQEQLGNRLYRNAENFFHLLLTTAESVLIGERGELLAERPPSTKIDTRPQLPERPVY